MTGTIGQKLGNAAAAIAFKGDPRPAEVVLEEIRAIFTAASTLIIQEILDTTKGWQTRMLVGAFNSQNGELQLRAERQAAGSVGVSAHDYQTRFGRTALAELSDLIIDSYAPVFVDQSIWQSIKGWSLRLKALFLHGKNAVEMPDDVCLVRINMEGLAAQIERGMSAHRRIEIKRALRRFLIDRCDLPQDLATDLIDRLRADEGIHPRYAEETGRLFDGMTAIKINIGMRKASCRSKRC